MKLDFDITKSSNFRYFFHPEMTVFFGLCRGDVSHTSPLHALLFARDRRPGAAGGLVRAGTGGGAITGGGTTGGAITGGGTAGAGATGIGTGPRAGAGNAVGTEFTGITGKE